MKYLMLASAGRLTGLANMLEQLGHDTEDILIARGMEAPYLFVSDAEGYKAGCRLFHPQWMNLYLHPHGFHSKEERIAAADLPLYLRTNAPAMLTLNVGKGVVRPVVCSSYAEGKYTFINIKPAFSAEPDTFTLTTATLKRRLTDSSVVLTVDRCIPTAADVVTPLLASLRTLNAYLPDVMSARMKTVTREEFAHLQERMFRPLMQDLLPMMPLTNDSILAEELRLLNHDYRHVFTCNDGDTVALEDKLPRNSIRQCVTWLREDILDRLDALGVSDELIDTFCK